MVKVIKTWDGAPLSDTTYSLGTLEIKVGLQIEAGLGYRAKPYPETKNRSGHTAH